MQDVYKSLIGFAFACACESVRRDIAIADYSRQECGTTLLDTTIDVIRSTCSAPRVAWKVYKNHSNLVTYSPEKGGFVPKGVA